uniref:Uncharacterized protein n=1 Tax=Helianthus annuus TaxID=4232 RepID=A0A251VDY9_HELAN
MPIPVFKSGGSTWRSRHCDEFDDQIQASINSMRSTLIKLHSLKCGVLPVAHKLVKGVLLKSAEKLKPYMMPALTSLGESLDMYHKVVAAVCDGTTANIENKDDDEEPANECKLEKGSVDEVQQADESKLTTATSDHVDQEKLCGLQDDFMAMLLLIVMTSEMLRMPSTNLMMYGKMISMMYLGEILRRVM